MISHPFPTRVRLPNPLIYMKITDFKLEFPIYKKNFILYRFCKYTVSCRKMICRRGLGVSSQSACVESNLDFDFETQNSMFEQ